MEIYSIEIGTKPGLKTPGEFLRNIISGTNINIKDMPDRILEGNIWEWIIPEDQTKLYEKHRLTIKQRITSLYNNKEISYGSW